MKSVDIYICGVDWQHEIGAAAGKMDYYNSVEELKRHKKCWKECGIVKLKVSLDSWVEEQNLELMRQNAVKIGSDE